MRKKEKERERGSKRSWGGRWVAVGEAMRFPITLVTDVRSVEGVIGVHDTRRNLYIHYLCFSLVLIVDRHGIQC